MEQATCRACGTIKAATAFARDRTKARGYKSTCKDCDNAKSKRYYHSNRDRVLQRIKRQKLRPRAQIEPRPCRHCGTTYQPQYHRQRYCSLQCHNATRVKAIVWLHCATCSKTFPRTKREAQRQPKHYCSKRCVHANHSTALVGPITTPGPRSHMRDAPTVRIFTARSCACGRTIIAEGRRAPATCGQCPPVPFTAGYCGECGSSFVYRDRTEQRFCSTLCARRNQRRRYKHTRNTRIQQAAQRETIDIAHVAARDGWRCHICGCKVNRGTWSLDHLVPLVHGGDHTYANVALAHHLCNSLRGADGHAQLRLAA